MYLPTLLESAVQGDSSSVSVPALVSMMAFAPVVAHVAPSAVGFGSLAGPAATRFGRVLVPAQDATPQNEVRVAHATVGARGGGEALPKDMSNRLRYRG